MSLSDDRSIDGAGGAANASSSSSSRQTRGQGTLEPRALVERLDFEELLIAMVGHELRNPLAAISFAITLLREQDTLAPQRTRSLYERIHESSQRANRLISELLDFAAVREGRALLLDRRRGDFHDLVRAAVAEVRQVCPQRRINLQAHGDGAGRWDGDRIAQIVINLLNNALAYSPEESPVRVSTQGGGATVVLTVHNAGAPIPRKLLPQVFQPLVRGEHGTAGARGGLGLGLHIVDLVVRAHGGTIDVSSTKTNGTIFKVTLPRAAA